MKIVFSMKKIFTFLIIFLAFLENYGQISFEWIAKNDTIQTIPVTDTLVAFDGDLKNKTNRSLDILVIKQSIQNPRNWANYLCVAGNCYTPNQDTLRLTVGPNETIEMKYDVDVIAPSNGDFATFKVTIVNNQNTEEFVTRNFRVNVHQTNKSKAVTQLFSIYPNPVSNQLFVKNETYHVISTDILDLNGQLIQTHNQTIIDVSNLPPNVYFLRINRIDGYLEYHKFIKE